MGKGNPHIGVVDSKSVRSARSDSEKGIDGGKRIKGIKRHILVDSNGFPLQALVTRANEHDTHAVLPLVDSLGDSFSTLLRIKADKGYKGLVGHELFNLRHIELDCVKSNYGSSEFVPLDGRWVVERTFAWLDSYRRLNCNYEKTLRSARAMTLMACVMFMLRYVS